jgi:hypothetical protein
MNRLRLKPARTLTTAAALVLAAGIAAQGVNAQGVNTQGVIGKWSNEQTCGAQSRQIVFRGNTMELWDANQRLFTGNVRFRTTGNETAVTILSIGRDTPQLEGNPVVGDVASFRREGNRMFPVAVVRNGQRQVAPSNGPPFYLCP